MDIKTEAVYKKVLKDVKAGATQREACNKHGVPPSTFSYWKVHGNGRKVNEPMAKPKEEIKVKRKKQGEDDISVVVFKGDSEAIAKALKGVL